MERIPVEKWLIRWSGQRVFEKIWLPLLKAKLGDHYKETSASFIWSNDTTYVRCTQNRIEEGNVRICHRRLQEDYYFFYSKASSLGVKIVLNSDVRKISSEIRDKISVETGSSEEYMFDFVISTLPSDISVRIAPDLWR